LPKEDKKEKTAISEIENKDLMDLIFKEFMPFIAKYRTDERNKKVSKLLKQDHHTSFF
jgi:hypothetical protein